MKRFTTKFLMVIVWRKVSDQTGLQFKEKLICLVLDYLLAAIAPYQKFIIALWKNTCGSFASLSVTDVYYEPGSFPSMST